MGLDEFKTYPKWVRILKQKAESRDLSFFAERVNPKKGKAYKFQISSDTAAVIGKTHHSNKSDNRIKSHIEMVYKFEKDLITPNTELKTNEDEYDEIRVLAIVINHMSGGEYNLATDDFLILDEQILEHEIPSSNQKRFRDDSNGYPPPFGKYVNDWEKIFEVFK